FFGREGIEECRDIVAGPFGAWIVGTTDGMIDLVDPIQDKPQGMTDAFFSYLDLDLTELDFSTLFGSDGRDGGTTIGAAPAPPDTASGKTGGGEAVDYYVVYGGWTQGHGLPVTDDAYQSSHGEGSDQFFGTVFHNTEEGSNRWVFGTYWGSQGDEFLETMAINRKFAVFGGSTNSGGLNTVGRPFNGGQIDAFAMGTKLPIGRYPMEFSYVGPSSEFNLGLAVDATKLGTVAVGGFTSVPGFGNAFTDVYNVGGDLLQTFFTGGDPNAYCLTLDIDYGHVSCGGRTAGEVFTTPDAFQRSYGGGEFDMHGSIHALEVSYSHVFNMTGTELTGTFNGRDLKNPIPSHAPSPVQAISWNSEEAWTYFLAGSASYEINHQPKGKEERLIYSFAFDDRVETVNPPTIAPGSGELGVLAFNYLGRSIEVIRTDQTPEHNIIKQTTVTEGQFFFVPLPYDQNLRITDGTASVDWTPPRKLYKLQLPHVTGYLGDQNSGGKGKSQGLNLVLFTPTGAPVEFPVTTAAETSELPGDAGRAGGPELRSSYPNPFTGSTNIGYNLTGFSQVNLSIFDIMGRRVRTLVDAHQGAGVYELRWDGTDATGAALPSGLYIYRLATDSQHVEGSMLLTK
ncbi:MAG: FlgD immunoglobulin-like domain containing protein, partial [Pirellulaceae bacterium]